jgi:Ribbon-helix-helix protein, copG family.
MVKELSIKLSDELDAQLEKLKEKTNKSKADVIREALLMYLGIGAVSDKSISDTRSYILQRCIVVSVVGVVGSLFRAS